MASRADQASRRSRRPQAERPRFELDRVWVLRAILAIVVVGMVAIITKVSIMAFGGSDNRLQRHERAMEATPPPLGDAPTKPAPSPAPR